MKIWSVIVFPGNNIISPKYKHIGEQFTTDMISVWNHTASRRFKVEVLFSQQELIQFLQN